MDQLEKGAPQPLHAVRVLKVQDCRAEVGLHVSPPLTTHRAALCSVCSLNNCVWQAVSPPPPFLGQGGPDLSFQPVEFSSLN